MRNLTKFPALLLCLTMSGLALTQAQNPSRAETEHEPRPTGADDVNSSFAGHHDTANAPTELTSLITREPERVVGKTLVLVEGTQTRTVGPVLGVRKHRNDQRAYLIIDGSKYFVAPATWVVAVHHLDRIDGNKLITPAAPGMHLRGMEYDADEYEDLPEPVVSPRED